MLRHLNKHDYDITIEAVMEYCIKNRIERIYDLRNKNTKKYRDLLTAAAASDPIDKFIEIKNFAELIYQVKNGSYTKVEKLISNLEDELCENEEIVNVAQTKLDEAWADYVMDYPDMAIKDDVLDLVIDDNRDRARSLRGI